MSKNQLFDNQQLDTPPLGLTEESFFSSEAEFRLALLNAYAKLTDWYWCRGSSGAILHRLWHLPDDGIRKNRGDSPTVKPTGSS